MKNKTVALLLMAELVILVLIFIGRIVPGLLLDARLLFVAKLLGFTLLLLIAAVLFLLLVMERRWTASALFVFSLSIATPLYLWLLMKMPPAQVLVTVVMIILVFFGLTMLRSPAARKGFSSKAEHDIKELKEGDDRILDEIEDIKKIAELKAPPLPPQEKQVIGSKTGMKVHDPNCIIVARIPKDSRITFKTLGDAIRNKYTACKVCMPGK
ncbi:MAG: hypothetical protein V1735_05535 [Nanoarchaeota archaeon]